MFSMTVFFAVYFLLLETHAILARLEVGESIKSSFKKEEGKALTGWLISSHNVNSPAECTLECMTTGPLCKSFNYKPNSGPNKHVCQLNSRTRLQKPSNYVIDGGFVHYYNSYFENIKTCLDILRMGITKSGIYRFHIGDVLATVYCDLDTEASSAWTLIMSYSFKNRNLDHFCRSPMSISKPYDKYNPNWDAYRMALTDMQELAKVSTYVRITTGFNKYGIDYRDYIRATIANLDVLTFNGHGDCRKVDYINIRGISGRSTLTRFWQGADYMIHIDSSFLPGNCQFDASSGSVPNNDDFGNYCSGYYNTAFRGCENEDSTTNFWFGGYL